MSVIDEILGSTRNRVAAIEEIRKQRASSVVAWTERIARCQQEIITLTGEIKRINDADGELHDELIRLLRILSTQDPTPQPTPPTPPTPVTEPETAAPEPGGVVVPEDSSEAPPEVPPVTEPSQLGLSTQVGMSHPKLALTCEAILATFGHYTTTISLTTLADWYAKVEPRAQPQSQRDAIYRATRHLVAAGHLVKIPTRRGTPARWRFKTPRAHA